MLCDVGNIDGGSDGDGDGNGDIMIIMAITRND